MPFSRKRFFKPSAARNMKGFRRFVRKRRARRRRVPPSTQVPGVSPGFPLKTKFIHTYNDTALMTSTTGVINSKWFRCNSLFDPDAQGTGHKAMWFDQLSAVYNHYTVIGSIINFQVVVDGSSAQVPMKMVFWYNDDTGTPSTLEAMAEAKGSVVRITGGSNTPNIFVRRKWSAKKSFGGSILGNDELQGSTTQNPVETMFYYVSLQALDQASTVSVRLITTIRYIAIWDELKQLNLQ